MLSDQQMAVGTALGSDTLYLWGPAGTGKSTTVADIVAALEPTDTVLIVASTNDAVDSVLLKILDRLPDDALLRDGRVLRFGPVVNDELRARYGQQIDFDVVTARRREEIGTLISELDERIAFLEFERLALAGALRRAAIGTTDALDAALRPTMRLRLRVACLEISSLRTEADAMRRRLDTVDDDVMARCRVMATTVHRAYLPGQIRRDFDTVIIDEAAAVMAPMAIAAEARARRRIICAGDFRQLGAPVQARTIAARRWLGRDVFGLADIPRLIRQRLSPPHLVTLHVQFRMSPDIAWLVNEPVYCGQLVNDPSVEARTRGPLGDSALIYVDTSRLQSRTVRRESGTRTNAIHALVVSSLIESIVRKDGALGRTNARDPMAVISPYRGQIDLIRRELSRVAGAEDVEVATVHRFQGGEREIVIAELSDSVGAELGHFMRARNLEDESARLLNVMLTRAKRHIVLVANFDYLLRAAPHDGLLREFLLRFRERGRRVDVKRLLAKG